MSARIVDSSESRLRVATLSYHLLMLTSCEQDLATGFLETTDQLARAVPSGGAT